jgi:hypothetical protein
MRKVLLVLIAVTTLNGCAVLDYGREVYDAYMLPPYDNNEYGGIVRVRTLSELAIVTCPDRELTEKRIDAIFAEATYIKNFTQLIPDNEDAQVMTYNLFLIAEQLKKYYEKHPKVSDTYCKLKLQQIEKSAITIQKSLREETTMTLDEIEQAAAEYQALHESGEISNEEFVDLMSGLEFAAVIADRAEDLERKANIQKAVNIAIDAASVL